MALEPRTVVNQPLTRFMAKAELERQQAAILRKAIGDAHDEGRAVTLPTRLAKPEPGDLRGIPALAQGVGGVIRGTQPETETIRRMSLERYAA